MQNQNNLMLYTLLYVLVCSFYLKAFANFTNFIHANFMLMKLDIVNMTYEQMFRNIKKNSKKKYSKYSDKPLT